MPARKFVTSLTFVDGFATAGAGDFIATGDLPSGAGTVTSVDASGGTTGLSFTGGPVVGSGTLTLGGTLAVAAGGTGGASAPAARTNLGLGTSSTLDSDTDTTLSANSNSRLATQAAVKSYVDTLVTGLNWKASVRAATTAAGTLATSFADGSVVDGVTLATGDRVLVKNQAAGSENGVYVVAASGAPARPTDADTGAELVSAAVLVREGTANADTQWVCSNDSVVLGTTAVVFVQVGGAGTYVAGAGLVLTGNAFAVATGGVTNAMLAGSITAAKLVGTDVATVGTLTSGTWNATAVAVLYGGTGATTAAGARTNLGLVIGTDVQAYDAELAALAGLASAADRLPYFTGSGTAALATFTSAGRALVDDADAAAQRTTLGLGTLATQNRTDSDFANTGLKVRGADAAFRLVVAVGGNLTADRTLTLFTPNGSDVSLTLSANATLSGTNTGDQTSVTGNAGTATALQTARNINGVAFDGTANVTVTAAAGTLTGTTLAAGVVTSGLTSVGTVTGGTWNATAIDVAHGGTGQTTAALARSSAGLNVESATGHGDSAYTVLATDRFVYTNAAFTASRTWTLPAANAVNAGGQVVVADLQGTVTSANTLVVSRAGTDTINGGTSVTLSEARGFLVLVSDGVSKWQARLLQGTNSGTNTGDQTITLTGDVTGTGTGSFAATVVAAGDATAGKIQVATQADQEAATSTTRAVTPGRQQYHPAAAKAYVYFTVAGTTVTVQRSYNVASVVRNSVGNFTVTFTTAFSDANYTVTALPGVNVAVTHNMYARDAGTRAAGSFQFTLVQLDVPGTLDDPARCSLVFYGDQ